MATYMNDDLLIICSEIDDSVIQCVLNDIDPTKGSNRLIILLDTYGGSPAVAYRVMQHLHHIYKHIYVVVYDKAMSAGTLMCLGSDVIYMFNGSSLGPLDLQIPHPTDGGQISTLDVRESMYDISSLAVTISKNLFEQSYYELKIGKYQAAKIAHRSATLLLQPMVQKIDPYHLHASYRNAAVGQKYARILLMNRMMQNDVNTARRTSKILAEDYEMHSYAITMDEAQKYLNLNVRDMLELDTYDTIKEVITSIKQPTVAFVKADKEKEAKDEQTAEISSTDTKEGNEDEKER